MITVRDIDDDVKAKLRIRAAENGRSMAGWSSRPRPVSWTNCSTGSSAIHLADAQIAGVRRSYPATLLTRNVRDFEGLGIEAIDPWTAEPLG